MRCAGTTNTWPKAFAFFSEQLAPLLAFILDQIRLQSCTCKSFLASVLAFTVLSLAAIIAVDATQVMRRPKEAPNKVTVDMKVNTHVIQRCAGNGKVSFAFTNWDIYKLPYGWWTGTIPTSSIEPTDIVTAPLIGPFVFTKILCFSLTPILRLELSSSLTSTLVKRCVQ